VEEWLSVSTKFAVLIIDAMVLLIVAIGSIEAFVSGLRVMLSPSATGRERRDVWLRYARWLVAGLTFQLAADIIKTSITPSWAEVTKLGVIAVIRTFLNFFLERDLAEVRDWQHVQVGNPEKH
jgi:uncharacterized membrane protein